VGGGDVSSVIVLRGDEFWGGLRRIQERGHVKDRGD
jgi:hypothetical protein